MYIMETIAAVGAIVGGGVIVMMSGLVIFAKHITNKLNEENEMKMNKICNDFADQIEADNLAKENANLSAASA